MDTGPQACSAGTAASPATAGDARIPEGGSGDPPPVGGSIAPPLPDAGVGADAASSDAQVAADAGDVVDAGSDAALPDAGPLPATLPTTLAETGLFVAGSTSELAPGVMAYVPRYELWADDAEKQRWLYLPPDAQIDSSDMDAWNFPVGTKAWKLFARDGKKLETRLFWKTEDGWLRVAFAWNDAETEATAVPTGQRDVRDTEHDIPSRTACLECHQGLPDRLLGVSAIQLSHSGAGMTLSTLIADDRLSDPPANDFALPDTNDWNALGYLHANCGHCHNPLSESFDRVDLELWLRVDELGAPADTASYRTTVNVMLTDTASALGFRITPGTADTSGMIERMQLRGNEQAMPPLATERVDDAGVGSVRTFIDDL